MKARLVALTLVLALGLLAVLPARAQVQWKMVLYAQNGIDDVLITVTQDGVAAIEPVPAALYAEGKQIFDVALSLDGRYLAVSLTDYTPENAEIRIADLDGTCCVTVNLRAEAFDLGSFSPGTDALAFSYYGAYALDAEGRGGIATADLLTGEIRHLFTMRDFDTAVTYNFPPAWAHMGDWTPDGINFYPNCYGCEPVFEGEYMRWRPDEGTLRLDTGMYFGMFSSTLDATNEVVELVYDERFPVLNEPGFFPPPNVVQYFPEGGLSSQGAGTPIYFSPGMLKIESVHWINDGSAILIDSALDEGRTMLTRNGFLLEFAVEPNNRVLAGTPDGWVELAILDDGTPVLKINGQGAAGDVRLDGFAGYEFTVLQAPPMGRTMDPLPSAFPEVFPPPTQ
ncbi:MAG: hypothetical protein ACOCX5_04245 [Chloroflexota bacterium]